MPWASTALSVGGSLLSGGLGSSSAKKAASKARQAMKEQIARIEAAKTEIGYDLEPYVEGGGDAQNKLSYLLGTQDLKGTDRYTQNDFAQLARQMMAAAGVKSSRIDAGSLKEGVRLFKLYADGGYQKDFLKAHMHGKDPAAFGLRELKDRALDTSDGKYGSLLKPFTNDDFVKDPGYLSRLLEGEQGEKRNLIARGASDSGQALKELERYRQMYASNEFGNAFNRDSVNKSNTVNFLGGDANRGLNATGTKANAFLGATNSQNAASQNGVNTSNALNLQASDSLSGGISSAISNLIYGLNRNGQYGRTPDFNPYANSSRDPAYKLYV